MNPTAPLSEPIVLQNQLAATVGERARRRITRRLLPFLLLLYLIAYIDRTNIGVAKLQMQGELKFTDAIIGLGAGIFFLGYFLFEIPGTLIVERWSARKWIARIMISWGIVATVMGFIGTPWLGFLNNVQQFYWLRLILGVAEAGFFPGVIVYLSHWFRYEDRGKAKSKFMIGIPLATIIGIPLSRLILENVHWYGLAGWRWVFILEGIPSVIFGIITLFYLTDWPHEAKWLPADEKEWLVDELARERDQKNNAGHAKVWAAFKHPQIWLLALIYFFGVTANYGLNFFMPSITDAMKGISIFWRTVFAMLPYVCTLCAMLYMGQSTDRTGERRWHIAIPLIILSVGLGLTILTGDFISLTITCLCLAGFGGASAWPAFWASPSAFLTQSAAAAAIGLINSVGNLGGFIGPYVVGYLKTETGNYRAAMWFMAGCALVAGLLATQLRIPKKKSSNS